MHRQRHDVAPISSPSPLSFAGFAAATPGLWARGPPLKDRGSLFSTTIEPLGSNGAGEPRLGWGWERAAPHLQFVDNPSVPSLPKWPLLGDPHATPDVSLLPACLSVPLPQRKTQKEQTWGCGERAVLRPPIPTSRHPSCSPITASNPLQMTPKRQRPAAGPCVAG